MARSAARGGGGRVTSVTRERMRALRWSAGFESLASLLPWRIANTVAPFWGPTTMLLAATAGRSGPEDGSAGCRGAHEHGGRAR